MGQWIGFRSDCFDCGWFIGRCLPLMVDQCLFKTQKCSALAWPNGLKNFSAMYIPLSSKLYSEVCLITLLFQGGTYQLILQIRRHWLDYITQLIDLLESHNYVRFQLWVGPGSRAAKEKQYFDTHLAPFYRIEQVVFLIWLLVICRV